MVHPPCGQALRQHEVVLLNASKVLKGLLAKPTTPSLQFPELIAVICQQCTALRERSAACRIQRAVRRRAAKQRELAQLRSLPKPLPPSLLSRSLPGAKVAPPPKVGIGSGVGAEAPKHVEAVELIRPVPAPPLNYAYAPAPPAPGGRALNPIEKRRQMVASQLAACNPSRLPRSRRPMFIPKAATARPTASRAESPSTPRGRLPELAMSARQSPRSVPLSPVRSLEAAPVTPGRSRTASPRLASPVRSLAPLVRCGEGPYDSSIKDCNTDPRDLEDMDSFEGRGAFAATHIPSMAPPPPLRAG